MTCLSTSRYKHFLAWFSRLRPMTSSLHSWRLGLPYGKGQAEDNPFQLTFLDEPLLRFYYHNGYPDCQQDERPYQTSCQRKSSDANWAAMSQWLTRDPTFLKKLESHRRELRRKIEGSKAEGTTRNKSRRTAPPVGTGSSSSTARPNDRNLLQPPQRPMYEGRQ